MSFYQQISEREIATEQAASNLQKYASGNAAHGVKISEVSQEKLHHMRQQAEILGAVHNDETPLDQRSLFSDLEYSALTTGHSRQLTPERFINVCFASFPNAANIPNEQWLLLRNSTFPYSSIIPEEQEAIRGIEDKIWQLVQAGQFVIIIYLILELRKRKQPPPLIVVNAGGDVAFNGGIINKDKGQLYFGSAENIGGLVVGPEEIDVSAQFERPSNGHYRPVYAFQSPASASKRLTFFPSQLPYMHSSATHLVRENLSNVTTHKDVARTAHLLGMLGPAASPAVKELSTRLETSDSEDLRSIFVDILGDISSSDAVESLLKHADSEQSHQVQEILLSALLRIGSIEAVEGVFDRLACLRPSSVLLEAAAKHVTDELIERFLKGSNRCRQSAHPLLIASFLRRLDPLRLSQILTNLLQADGSDDFKVLLLRTIEALGKENSYWNSNTIQHFLPYLVNYLEHPNPDISLSAARLIHVYAQLHYGLPVGPLIAPGLENPDPLVRSELASSLYMTSAKEDHRLLKKMYRSETDSRLKAKLKSYLDLIREYESTDRLADNYFARAAAIIGLGYMVVLAEIWLSVSLITRREFLMYLLVVLFGVAMLRGILGGLYDRGFFISAVIIIVITGFLFVLQYQM